MGGCGCLHNAGAISMSWINATCLIDISYQSTGTDCHQCSINLIATFMRGSIDTCLERALALGRNERMAENAAGGRGGSAPRNRGPAWWGDTPGSSNANSHLGACADKPKIRQRKLDWRTA